MTAAVRELEEYFQTDAVQEKLSHFMHKEAMVNTVFAGGVDDAAEQRHDYHTVWRRYQALMDTVLDSFADSCSSAADKAAMAAELAEVDSCWDEYVCAPYIAAGLEYRDFLRLVGQWCESYDLPEPDCSDS
eukprot:TRINITY_DN22703_c0_g1_i1.p1 TRINITY_DN22703_c0_g1~~TRINITY_DN22703_c0_g1_i1.p1  ORF type:complete len:131 (+),score=53.88 TRINITY_DN22703_c0_g1_i1:79-471(+)